MVKEFGSWDEDIGGLNGVTLDAGTSSSLSKPSMYESLDLEVELRCFVVFVDDKLIVKILFFSNIISSNVNLFFRNFLLIVPNRTMDGRE